MNISSGLGRSFADANRVGPAGELSVPLAYVAG